MNTQTSQVDNFITQKVDLLLISPFEAAPLTPAVKRAMKAGIPVIELDRKTVGDPGKDYTAFIGGDNYKIAEEAGNYTAKTLLPDGGEVAVLEGLPSSTPGGRAAERLQGRRQGTTPRSRSSPSRRPTGCRTRPQTAFAAMLQAHPDIKVVYASNDMMAAGARLAAKGAGKKDQIKIIGTDGLPGPAGGIRAVAEGEWAATFTYPTGGPEAIDMAKKILLDCADPFAAVVTVPTTGDHARQRQEPNGRELMEGAARWPRRLSALKSAAVRRASPGDGHEQHRSETELVSAADTQHLSHHVRPAVPAAWTVEMVRLPHC